MFGWGLVAAYAMTFLDTVDGKLARVTLTSSPIGNVFDHGIDLVHPPFWWWAWIVGLAHAGFDLPASDLVQIGRASCRERVCQYVKISVVAGSLKKKQRERERLVYAYEIIGNTDMRDNR